MSNLLGVLDLKIARLEQRLKVLELQQAMSKSFPTYQDHLIQEQQRTRLQLQKLTQHRRQLLQSTSAENFE